MEFKKLEKESRHSDYGSDAGGYSILRFDGKWLGRIEDRDAAEELILYVNSLEQKVKTLQEAFANRLAAAEYTRQIKGDRR